MNLFFREFGSGKSLIIVHGLFGMSDNWVTLGKRFAINVALHQLQFVSKLVIVDISMRSYPPLEDQLHLMQIMQQLDLSKIKRRSEAERKLEHMTPSLRLQQFLLKNLYWLERDKLAWRMNLQVINENIPALFGTKEVLGVFHGPTLFVKGEKSDYIGDEDRVAIKEKFPGSRIRTIEGASHWVHADRPGEFYQVVSDFLQR